MRRESLRALRLSFIVFSMNMLTAREIRLLAFILGAVLLGAGVKTWRESCLVAPALSSAAAP